MPEPRAVTEHVLKVVPPFFDRLLDGTKTFEVRRDDRGFQSGDLLVLREYDPPRCYRWPGDCGSDHCPAWTGRALRRRVGFVFRQGFGIDLGEFVVLSLLPEEAGPDA